MIGLWRGGQNTGKFTSFRASEWVQSLHLMINALKTHMQRNLNKKEMQHQIRLF